ncbi:hypothetical protein GCM10007940_38650 [Portibacter lacus]|uniref:Gliding motility-associated C-terminal domain-containing protein n=2 Tax=Portibacter lacus TaxID=1099794 RepID=A0AA37STA3_9BACT|nr:hypothetical protein GCM10007940_38650 [Portibacter lacus]
MQSSALDYYWVGGSGNWSDISHWAAVSGGTVTYPTAPTSEDNVIFDANSFTGPNQTITFVNNIIFCKNMDWSGVTNNPTLAGPRSVTINVFGNLSFSPGMQLDFEGELIFTGVVEDKDIDFSGLTIPGVVTFAGESNWNIFSMTNVDSLLEISRGNVNFNGMPINCRFLHINTTGAKSIDFSNSEIIISGAYLDEYGYNGDGSVSFIMDNSNLNMEASGSTIQLTAENATFHHTGGNSVALNDVLFTATTGSVYMTSNWHTEPLILRNISFASSGLIEGTIHAENITFGAGGRYRFGAERNYKFGSITAMGDCVEGVVLISDNPGFESVFTIASGSIDLNYITLRDIHGEGGATLNANNGVDLGNNTGWIFTNSTPVDFYWIGGSGSWDDPMHWSFTSGGPPSGCVPSGKDNAFFDVNSFTGPNQSVSLNNDGTFIHDMIWNGVVGNPEFTGEALQTMIVTGSLELAVGMEHDIMGFYNFESPEVGNTIRMNGNIFNESITFSGIGADWTFLDDVEVYRILYFRSGTLNTNGNQVTVTRFNANSTLERMLIIENSNIILRQSANQGPEWRVNLENYTVSADLSNITFNDNGVFNHEGTGSNYIPSYNELVFNALIGSVYSINGATPEERATIHVNHLTFTGRGNMLGSNEFGIVELADGFAYSFDSGFGRKQSIDDLRTQGSCAAGLTQLFGSASANLASIELTQPHLLERMYIRDLEVLSNNLTSNSSIDGGNNLNVVFTELSGRRLYWVGDEGIWQETAHWSLTSGGPGGECIPTALDTVVFDELSFSLDNQNVTGTPSQTAFCSNIYSLNLFGDPRIDLNFLMVNGSLEFDQTFRNNIDEFIFIGANAEDVITGGQNMNNVRFRSEGIYTFRDDHEFNHYEHDAGHVIFDDVNVVGNYMQFQNDNEKSLELRDSKITLYDTGDYGFYDRGNNLMLDAGTSELIFTGESAGAFSRSAIELNKVTFSNTEGTGNLGSRYNWQATDYTSTIGARSITFNGNGRIIGNLTSDTIIGVAGKIYELDSDREVFVSEYLQLRGNNCTPIELRSSINAINATISMPPTAEIVMDFVQMKDITGVGGAEFNAGARSVNVGNTNIGWIFQDAPDFIDTGFLGTDRTICEGEPVELTAFSYSPNEEYLWSDGSTDSVFITTTAGTYFVEVQFESNCILRDTVVITDAQLYEADLPDQVNICSDGFVQLDAAVALDEATYLWEDGSTTSMIEVTEAGKYKVAIEALGCITEDSTVVEIIEDPGPFLPEDRAFCEGEVVIVVPLITGESYTWKDGSVGDDYASATGDSLWLDLEMEGCVFRDSIILRALAIPEIDMESDTAICESATLTISLSSANTYLWNDGSTSNEYEINTSGKYIVEAENNGCINKDSIQVSLLPSPIVDIGNDIRSCISEDVFLSVPDPNVDFVWEDGSNDMDRAIEVSGEYWLEVEEDGCAGRDTIIVELLSLPVIDLGLDTVVCEYEIFIVDPVSLSNGDIRWQDGSTEETFEVVSPGLITASIFDGECSNTDSIMVDFKDCTFFDIYIPNVFSPNEDGYNDFFDIHLPENLIVESFSIQIFDRWGNRVFSSLNINDSWDGKLNTETLSAGVYIYFIDLDYIDENGPGSEFISGDIGIVR